MRARTHPLLDGQTKGLPARLDRIALEQVGRAGWNVLSEDLPLPLAILKDSALRHNSNWMRAFRSMTGVEIAPHGKTSMSPQLFARQLADGAWGITVASIQQLRVCRAQGIGRVLLANQLVGRQNIAYVLEELARDPAFEFVALVDSLASVDSLAAAAAAAGAPHRPLKLLVECGFQGGRTGCRTRAEGMAVARAVASAAPHLALVGVEGYEGAVPAGALAEQEGQIGAFVGFMAELASDIAAAGLFSSGLSAADPVILTAGGSAWFDLVTALPRTLGGRHTLVLIRSGCYLTHDSDAYARAATRMRERTPQVADLGPGLRDALEVWSYVQSTPEAGLAILTMGKRDVSHDLHLPYPRTVFRPGAQSRPSPLPPGFEITALNDQHAFLRMAATPSNAAASAQWTPALPDASPLRVGDMIGCAISHPCTTFDKWRFLPIVDDDYNVIDAITTAF